MYRDIAPELLEIVEPVVRAHELELVDVERSGVPGRGLRLRVVLDTRKGDGKVTVGECSKVSRELGHGLDAAGTMGSAYMLEVCSPGVDRILGRWSDFERAVGSEISVQTRAPLDSRRRFRGELLACSDEQIIDIRLSEGPEVRIPFAEVAKAKAYYSGDSKAKG